MKTTKANISLYVGGQYGLHEIDAYQTDVPGLVIHRRYKVNHETSEVKIDPKRGWTITQQPTGNAVKFGFRTRAHAEAFVKQISVYDWTFKDRAGITDDHRVGVRKAIDTTDREGLPA